MTLSSFAVDPDAARLTGPHLIAVPSPMRVVVAAESMLLREGLARLLTDVGFDVVGRSADAEDLLRKVGGHHPDVAVVDVSADSGLGDDGLRAATRIRAQWPETGVIALAENIAPALAMDLFAMGTEGLGYLLKDRISNLDQFSQAIQRVGSHGSSLDPRVVSRLLGRSPDRSGLELLTDREAEVMGLVADGHSNQSIATQLFLSERGVEKHMSNVYSKLALPRESAHHQRVLAVRAYLTSENSGAHKSRSSKSDARTSLSPLFRDGLR
jgi:DNA-binding NarL/FixJ family response regulator